MNESILAGILGLAAVTATSIYVVVKIQAIKKMGQTPVTPLLGVAMPQEKSNKKK